MGCNSSKAKNEGNAEAQREDVSPPKGATNLTVESDVVVESMDQPASGNYIQSLGATKSVEQALQDMEINFEHFNEEKDLIINQYHLTKILGVGTQATVRLAKDTSGNSFAVKIIPKNKRNAFRRKRDRTIQNDSVTPSTAALQSLLIDNTLAREIAILKKLDHPHLVRLFEVLDSEKFDKVFVVMEFVDGGPIMNEKLKYQKPFPETQALDYFRQLLKGLEYLHHQGIIHRDIKPSNLLLSSSGILKIADFGVSLICNPVSDEPSLEGSGHSNGSNSSSSIKLENSCTTAPESNNVQSTSDMNSMYKNMFEAAAAARQTSVSIDQPKNVVYSTQDDQFEKIKSEEIKRSKGELYPKTPKVINGKHDDQMSNFSGTLAFSPPEVHGYVGVAENKFQGKAADVWAACVTLYIFVFGMVPFQGDSSKVLIANILSNDVYFPENVVISKACKDFILKSLEKDLALRIKSVQEAKIHLWVKTGWKKPETPGIDSNTIFSDFLTEDEVAAAVQDVDLSIAIEPLKKSKSWSRLKPFPVDHNLTTELETQKNMDLRLDTSRDENDSGSFITVGPMTAPVKNIRPESLLNQFHRKNLPETTRENQTPTSR